MKNDSPVYIYGLFDPRTAEIRYIGKTVNKKRRLQQHVYGSASKKMTPVRSWIIGLKKAGFDPRMMIIETCKETNWEERERFYIKHYRDAGMKLLNIAEGGNQPCCPQNTRTKNGLESSCVAENGIWFLKRTFKKIAEEASTKKQYDKAEKFQLLFDLVSNSIGAQRDKFNALGFEKMGARNG